MERGTSFIVTFASSPTLRILSIHGDLLDGNSGSSSVSSVEENELDENEVEQVPVYFFPSTCSY